MFSDIDLFFNSLPTHFFIFLHIPSFPFTYESIPIRFVNEVEVLDLMKAINSGDEDENILSFLGNSHIKEGELCHHIIMVLPRRAACDAMQKLISSHQEIKPLSEYITINAAGTVNRVKKLSQIKSIITNSEKNRKKTLTLTVNRMLTGTTVPEWDTMIFLKGTSSPQEYDQATYRLQNPYVVEYKNEEGKVVKRNMKPQTLLVDFSPERIFFLQEQRAFYNCANSHRLGNNWIEEEITRELSISPILFVNKDKLQEVTAVAIIDKLRQYSRDRSILDEARQIGPDYSLKDDKVLYEEIMRYAAIDSNNIMKTKAHEGEKTEADVPNNDSTIDQKDKNKNKKEEQKEPDNYEKRLATFFSHILFFAYLTKDKVRNLADILTVSNSKDNKRIAKHLDLDFSIIKRLTAKMNPSRRELLEFKIANINDLSHDDTKDPTEKVDQAMKQFGRWSESEIVTPANIADDMVALITKDRITKEFRILDIASKEGEFANALFKRFGEKVRYSIFSLPTSGVAYEFTRKVYEEIGLPIQNIISDFNSYSLVGKDKDKYIKRLKDMNFNAIVGNPPYQEGVNKEPIYHHFIDFCTHSEFSTLIHPGRFLFNAGKTPKIWNQKMLNDEHYSVVNFWKKSDEVFDSVDIKGGVAVTLWDKDNNIGPIGTFVLHEELHAIHENVEALGEGSFSQLVYSRDLYQLTETFYKEHPELEGRQSKGHRFDLGTTVFALFPEVFFDKKPAEDGYAYVVGRDNDTRIGKWIKKDYLKLPDNFETYKVVLPKSNGSGHFGEQLSSPFVADPFHAQNTTFLSIGKFDTAQEAEACLKYIKTKFVRCLLGILKVTQDNPKSVWRAVPIQNFTPESEIDWNLAINEIDAALYAKYNLTPDEIDFIENNVRPME